jgi:hypothetical protein
MLGDWPVPNKLQTTGEPLVGGREYTHVFSSLAYMI